MIFRPPHKRAPWQPQFLEYQGVLLALFQLKIQVFALVDGSNATLV